MLNYLRVFFFYIIFLPSIGVAQDYNVVTNTFDSGIGSLRQAILNSNSNGQPIFFAIPESQYYSNYSSSVIIYINSPLPAITSTEPFTNSGYIHNGYSSTVTWQYDPNTRLYNSNINYNTPYYINSLPIQISGYGIKGPGIIFLGPDSIISYGSISPTTLINFSPTNYVVTNTNDSGPGSLREAIFFANLTSTKDTISFNIPGQGPYVINLLSNLPQITTPIIIDGSTQPGYIDGVETVVINGKTNSSYSYGLTLYGCSNVEIYGLTIKNCSNGVGTTGGVVFGFNVPPVQSITIGKKDKSNTFIQNTVGILIDVNNATNIIINNNYIGTTAAGDTGMGNTAGIIVSSYSCTISENTISGNRQYGIDCADTYTNVANQANLYMGGTITKNKIGTDPSGTYAIPNKYGGIRIWNPVNLVIGGNSLTDANIISGNNGDGVNILVGYFYYLYYTSAKSTGIQAHIYNNLIGTDFSGSNPLPNGGNGITADYLRGVFYIGDVGKGNVIAFNKGYAMDSANTSVIKHNSIFNNHKAIGSALAAPTISNRSVDSITGTTLPNLKVELYYDNGANLNVPQGKDFIASVLADGSGNWKYTGSITNPCNVTAIAVDTVNYITSSFSKGHGDLPPPTITNCYGDTAFLDAGAGYSAYLWSTGDTTREIKTLITGTYWVNVSNGCTYTDTIKVNFTNPPVVNLGKDTTLCYGQSITLDAGSLGTAATYSWSNNSTITTGKQQVTVYSFNEIIAQVAYGNCKNSDTIKLNVVPKLYSLTRAQANTICTGQPLGLTAYGYPYSSDTVGVKFLWSDASTSYTDTITQPGQYIVKVYNSCFTTNDTFNIAAYKNVLPKDTTICSSSIRLSLYVPGAGSYVWSNGAIGNSGISVSPGINWVQITMGSCVKTDTINVIQVQAPQSPNFGNQIICNGGHTVLNAKNDGSSFTWFDGHTTPQDTVYTSGKLWVRIFNTCGQMITDTFTVSASSVNASITLISPTTTCDSIELHANRGKGYTYQWYNASGDIVGGNDSIYVTRISGDYSVTVTDSNNCSATSAVDTAAIYVVPPPVIPNTYIYCSVTDTTINGLPPGKGTWKVVSGTGTFADSNLSTTEVSGLSIGTNEFLWTTTNSCGDIITNFVTIYVNIATQVIAGISADSYIVRPNPFTDYTIFRINAVKQENISITITDVNGVALYSSNYNTNEDIMLGSNLSSGIYFVQISFGSEVKVIKLVKI